MLVIQRPTIEALPSKADHRLQTFAIGPLDPGFGHTIGNSLRRTLLSSIPGAAVTQVRFDSAIHEFGTIQGVATDITDMILNLKDLVVRVLSDEPVTLRLDIRGPADVTASDILPNPDVEIINPELEIATINGPDRLALDITVARGRGYASATDEQDSTVAIGVIPVDAIFSPVRRVAFNVEATRVAQATDYDMLMLEVETDSSISPREALASAAATLRSLIELVEAMSEDPMGLSLSDNTAAMPVDETSEISIDDLGFTERPRNCLKRVQINTLNDLLTWSRDDLLAINNFGDKSLEEVIAVLDERGLSLRGDDEEDE